MSTLKTQYNPETVSHPGATLAEALQERGIGPKEFAIRAGKPEKTISQIIAGTSSITPDMAVLFEDVLKIPAHFWLNRQKQYDEAAAREKRKEVLAAATEWAKRFPYADMAKKGWVDTTRKPEEKVAYLFQFFSMASAQAFENYFFNQKLKLNFRISLAHTKKPYAFAAWIRKGELQAQELSVPSFDANVLMAVLPQIKTLMATHPQTFFSDLQEICATAGLKLVYTPCLEGAQVHGSTRWLGDTPLIQMSARYKQNDIFWFTFFHELAHVLKHGKKHVSIENVAYSEEDSLKEKEADAFAVKWTFSEEQEREVLANLPLDEDKIIAFAKKFNTHPAMIIGRFHFKKLLHYSVGRALIKKIEID